MKISLIRQLLVATCATWASVYACASGTAEIAWTRPILPDTGRYAAWPTVCGTAKWELLAVFSGDREAHICPYGKVQLVRSSDGGETWSSPLTVCDGPLDDRDAGILETRHGDLVLFWFTSVAFYEDRARRDSHPEYITCYNSVSDDVKRASLGSWARRSSDGGRTWSEPVRVPVMTPHGGVELKDGRILVVGVHDRLVDGLLAGDPNPPPKTFRVAASSDGGRSFETIGTIPTDGVAPHWSLAEPTLLALQV